MDSLSSQNFNLISKMFDIEYLIDINNGVAKNCSQRIIRWIKILYRL